MTFAAIPLELRDRPQWVIWKFEHRAGQPKPTKVPYRADGNGRASSTDPQTWATFEAAVAAAQNADGIGFVLTEDDGYVGIDLDGFLHDGRLNGSELDGTGIGAWIAALNSYTEVSPSGNGLRIIGRAVFPEPGKGGRKRGPFEAYTFDRFLTITGNVFEGLGELRDMPQDVLDAFHTVAFPPKPEPQLANALASSPVDLDDADLLAKAMGARGGTFSMLYSGTWEGHYPSQSEADLSLCSSLAFWTGRDFDRIDRLFRTSGLYRDKWDERRGDSTYGAMTIGEAIAGCSATYSPGVTRASESPESVGVSNGGSGATDSLTQPYRVSGSEPLPPRVSVGDSDPESVPLPERPFSLPISAFIALEREGVEPLLADDDGRAVVGRHSLTLVGALGGQGKTTYAIDTFLHLAAGVDYPPFTVPHPVSILLIENEGPEELFAEKLAARMATFPHELKGRLDVCTIEWGGFSLADDRLRSRLAQEIAEKGYDLVFGDPLDSMGIAGVGSPEDTRRFLDLMKQTGLHRSVAWWLNTHPRKEETKEALNEISGAWGGKPDTVMLLKMLDDDRTLIRFPKLRWAKRGRRPSILLGFDADTEAFTYLGEQSEDERDYKAEILERLGAFPWMTPKEISAPKKDGGIGANVETVKKVLKLHPDTFESRTGDAAVEVGRSKQATVWQVRPAEPEDGES